MDYNISYREKDGGLQYIISYKNENNQWKQKSKQGFKSKALAKRAAQERVKLIENDLSKKIILDKDYDGILFKDFKEIFLKFIEIYKEPGTVLNYETTVNVFIELWKLEVKKIQSTDIQCCIDEFVKRGVKSTTIKGYLLNLNQIFKYAITKKIIIDNPVKEVITPKKLNTEEKRALNKSELEDLLSKINYIQYYLISLIASKCGLRIGEILGLTWIDIDEKRCVIKINKQWKLLKKNENEKRRKHGFGTLKSKNSYREAPIPAKVLSELLKFKKEYPTNIDNRIFNQKTTGGTARKLALLYRRLGYDISVHELRHTYATLLIANGMDFKTAAKLLGHSVEQTIRTYSHVTSDMMDNASRLINNIF